MFSPSTLLNLAAIYLCVTKSLLLFLLQCEIELFFVEMESPVHSSGEVLDECLVSPQASSVQPDSLHRHLTLCSIEKRFSDHFADVELDHPHDDGYDFESNLQTTDSLSSLSVKSSFDDVVAVVTDQLTESSWETFEENGQKVSCSVSYKNKVEQDPK